MFNFLAFTLLIAVLFFIIGMAFHQHLVYGTSRRNHMALLAGTLVSYGLALFFCLILLFKAGVAYFQLFQTHM